MPSGAPGRIYRPAHWSCWQNSAPCHGQDWRCHFLVGYRWRAGHLPQSPTFLDSWPPSSTFKANNRASTLSCLTFPRHLSDLLDCLSLLRTRDWTEPTQIIHDNLISRFLTLITSAESLLPYKVTFTGSRAIFWGVSHRILLLFFFYISYPISQQIMSAQLSKDFQLSKPVENLPASTISMATSNPSWNCLPPCFSIVCNLCISLSTFFKTSVRSWFFCFSFFSYFVLFPLYST